jgi:hypothetical protein
MEGSALSLPAPTKRALHSRWRDVTTRNEKRETRNQKRTGRCLLLPSLQLHKAPEIRLVQVAHCPVRHAVMLPSKRPIT